MQRNVPVAAHDTSFYTTLMGRLPMFSGPAPKLGAHPCCAVGTALAKQMQAQPAATDNNSTR